MVESFEMASFLIVHVLHQRTEVWVCLCYGRRLGCVDEGCGQFSSMIDTKSLVQKLLLACSKRFGSLWLWCIALDVCRFGLARWRCIVDGARTECISSVQLESTWRQPCRRREVRGSDEKRHVESLKSLALRNEKGIIGEYDKMKWKGIEQIHNERQTQLEM